MGNGHSLTWINQGRLLIKTVGIKKEPLKSMGQLTVTPDMTIKEVKFDDVAIIILPGGDKWLTEENDALYPALQELQSNDIPIAAICGATAFIARYQLLAGRKHTSNHISYLKMNISDYNEDKNYINEPAVTDGNLITASGTQPLMFAEEIWKRLGVFDDKRLQEWYQYFNLSI